MAPHGLFLVSLALFTTAITATTASYHNTDEPHANLVVSQLALLIEVAKRDCNHCDVAPPVAGCTADGVLHLEGEYHVDEQCAVRVCQRGQLHLYTGTTPNVDFYKLLARNCVFQVGGGDATWEGARAQCVASGGDLYVAGDFQGMARYLHGYWGSGQVWIGARNRTWLDGRYVAASEWEAGEPKGNFDQCSYLDPASKTLRVGQCQTNYVTLCQKAVRFA